MQKRIKSKALSRFYNNLAVFVKSGLTIERGLATLMQNNKGVLHKMMDGLAIYISRGERLWEGMSYFPMYFDEFQIMIIKAAEESGKLVEICKSLASYYELRYKEKRRLMAGLIYPLILLHGAVLLPPLKYLILANLGKNYWSIVLPPLIIAYGSIGLGYFCWKKFLHKGPFRKMIDHILISLPIIGKLGKGMALARVLRALAHMNDAGIEAVKSAREAIKTAGNTVIADHLNAALPILERGGTFSDFFSYAGVLPSVQMGVVMVGEQTGTMAESLERMVAFMEEENHRRLTSTVKAAGILAYLIAASVVAMTVLGFYAKYFSF